MQSIKDESIMEYFWVVEYLKPYYKKHVSDYISHVVGHEGKNSLLSILKMKKYASELSAYTHDIKTQTLIGM
jgi:secreted Zn-dependent insulinase-like peptidase